MVKINLQVPSTPKSEEHTKRPIQKKCKIEWAKNFSNTKRQPKNDNITLVVFLVVAAICAILTVWIFGQASSPDSNNTTTQTHKPSSNQGENTITKPNTPSSENSKPTPSIPETPTQTEKPTTQTPSNSNSSTPSYGNICIHYEYGRCWDDLEDEAYDAGRWDGSYGYYGDSYYESDDCDDLCQDIMEDAYDEGYYDY